MNRNYKNSLGTPIVHTQTGHVLATVRDLIVDSDRGRIEAFWVHPVQSGIRFPIIQTQDILEWKKKIYVKDNEVIHDPAHVVRIRTIVEQNRLIAGNRAKGESGQNLGRVADFDFSDETWYLTTLYTQKSVLGLFSYEKRVFPASRIVEVLPDAVILDDDSRKKSPIITGPLLKNQEPAATPFSSDR